MTTPRPAKSRKLRWFLAAVVVFLVFLELLAGQFVARPNRIIRRSRDPEMVYENTPGTWLGHAKYDVWRAPLYMVLDFVYMGSDRRPTSAPPGYTLYRIDPDGCRAPSAGPIAPSDDVVVVGSSQSFGMLVPEEETVPAMLETALRARGFHEAHVANCGVIGHHFLQTLRTAEVVQRSKRAKLVVILVRPWHMREQVDYTEVLTPQNGALRWLVDHSSFIRLAYYVHRREPDQFNKPMISNSVLETRLDRYAREMNDAGVRTVFFLLDDGNTECSIYDGLGEMLRRRGFDVERIPTPSRPNYYFVDHDRHWSARGSALTTSQMVDTVARELRLAGTARR